jgi:hypothetical protein
VNKPWASDGLTDLNCVEAERPWAAREKPDTL